jgi:hypothetical protein
VEIATVAEAAHLCAAIALTRFFVVAARFGRFLPRLGPFDLRTAFFLAGAGYGTAAFAVASFRPRSGQMRILRGAALHKTHLFVMRCTFNFCGAICELPLASQPSLGVSSLDLGRSVTSGPFLLPE